MKAIELGYNYTRENFKCPLPMRVAPGRMERRRPRATS